MAKLNTFSKTSLLLPIMAFTLNLLGIINISDAQELQFNTNGEFKIMQLTDTHIERGDANDQQTVKLLETMLDAEQPDLVILTGDNIAITQDYKATIDILTKPLIDRKVKWAAVLGNHDDETKVDGKLTTFNRKDVMQYYCSKPYSLSQMGPEDIDGYGNYYLTIDSGNGSQTQWIMYMLDSHSYPKDKQDGKYDWIHFNQVIWYYNTSVSLEKRAEAADKTVKAMAFFHIPLPEYTAAFDYGNTLSGHKFEKVCSPDINSGLFTAMLERGDVKATFCGHDHVNDYESEYHGIRLCYGRSSGYNAYGKEKLPKGSKIITLNSNGTFTTRIVETK